MSALLLDERPLAVAGEFERDPCDLHDRSDRACVPERAGVHDRLTLDDLVTSLWEGLAVRATVACPVCAGPMASGTDKPGLDTPTGTCLCCGSRLS